MSRPRTSPFCSWMTQRWCALLEKLGAKVQVAEHGKQAIELYDDSIDLVILDLTMPVMDGVECLRQLRERHRDVCVLLSSGYPEEALATSNLASIYCVSADQPNHQDLNRFGKNTVLHGPAGQPG